MGVPEALSSLRLLGGSIRGVWRERLGRRRLRETAVEGGEVVGCEYALVARCGAQCLDEGCECSSGFDTRAEDVLDEAAGGGLALLLRSLVGFRLRG